MKVLITGGAGFIGSHLADLLIHQNVEVVAIDNLSTGSLSNISHLLDHKHFNFVRDDVRNEYILAQSAYDVDVIFHLAAALGVKNVVDNPVKTLETNIHGSESVLSLASKLGKKLFLASTSEVYGKNDKIPFREDSDSVIGSTSITRWSYACSKMVDEFLCFAHHEEYNLKVIIARFFNTVGPRQSGQYGMVVPRFVCSALRNEPLYVYGSGEQTRCFLHVKDAVKSIWKLIDEPSANGQIYNIGSQEVVSINNLARRIIKLSGSKSAVVHMSYEEAYGKTFEDMLARKPCLDKIKAKIDFKIEYDLDATLKDVIAFERSRL